MQPINTNRERQMQQHIASELQLARKLGRDSFKGVNRATYRNPYPPGPYHDEWQVGREEIQFHRPVEQSVDAPFKRSAFKYA